MSVYRVALFFVVSATLVPDIHAQELLTWKFKKGEQIRYGVVQNMQTSQKIGEKDVSSSISQQMDMGWNVLDIAANGSTVMNQTVDRIRLKMEGGPAGKIEFDTADNAPSDNPFLTRMKDVFGNIVKQPFTVTMTPSGKVENVKVPPLLLDAVRKSAAGNAGALSEDTLKDMMKQSAVTLPSQPVGPGSKWTSNQHVKLAFGTMTVQSTMAYVQKDSSGDIIIDVVPKITVAPSPNASTKMTLTSSSGRGRVMFNNEDGRVAQSQLDLTLQMTMEINGKTFDQVVKQTTAMKLVQ